MTLKVTENGIFSTNVKINISLKRVFFEIMIYAVVDTLKPGISKKYIVAINCLYIQIAA